MADLEHDEDLAHHVHPVALVPLHVPNPLAQEARQPTPVADELPLARIANPPLGNVDPLGQLQQQQELQVRQLQQQVRQLHQQVQQL